MRGAAAFVSQSGALGEAILGDARALGIGFSHFASIGNRVDVSPNDLLEYWGSDPDTGVILMYLESFGNPRNFVRIAREVTRRKPVIAVKGGGASAARAPPPPTRARSRGEMWHSTRRSSSAACSACRR